MVALLDLSFSNGYLKFLAEKKTVRRKKVHLAVTLFFQNPARYIKIRICKLPLFIITCYSVIDNRVHIV